MKAKGNLPDRQSATMAVTYADGKLWATARTKAHDMGLSGAEVLVLLLRAWVVGDIQIEHTVTTRIYAGRKEKP